jgi:uncharacterized LabA/DUF88 family protein
MRTAMEENMEKREFKTAFLIDGANIYVTCKNLNLALDFKKLREVLSSKDEDVVCRYYTALPEAGPAPQLRVLLDWLSYNGFKLVTKTMKVWSDGNGETKTKGNMDIEMAVDAMKMSKKVDRIVLATGDGDFVPLVLELQGMGISVDIVSTRNTKPSMCSDDLRRQANNFFDLDELRGSVSR